MKNATDAMKESRISDFLASVGVSIAVAIQIVICGFADSNLQSKLVLVFVGYSLMHFNTEGWILRSFVLLH